MSAKRSKTEHRKHDAEVRRQAEKLKAQRFDVKADLLGWEKPHTIGGRRPDVYGKKGKQEKVREVETEDSLDKDQEQRQKFRDWADRSDNRTAHTVVTRKKGNSLSITTFFVFPCTRTLP